MTKFKLFTILAICSSSHYLMANSITLLNTGCNNSATYQIVRSNEKIAIDKNSYSSNNFNTESGSISSNGRKTIDLQGNKESGYPQIIFAQSVTAEGKQVTTQLWLTQNRLCKISNKKHCRKINYADTSKIQVCHKK